MKRALLLLAVLLTYAPPRSLEAADGAIHSVAYSHGDLGYGNYPHVLRTENRLENLFRAIRFCDETAGWDPESQYRWQQEMAEPLPLFLSCCTAEQRAKLAKYVTEGRIAIAASHATVLGERLTPESAARLFYLGNRLIPDLLGTPPGRVAIINDVIGLPWSLPIYCEAAGVPFISNGHNGCARMEELESAPLVRWVGPGGTGSALTFSSVYNYHAVSHPLKEVPARVTADAKRITANFIPVWLQGHDFAITSLEMATAARSWNANGSPKVQMSTLPLYLATLAERQTPEKTPAVSKTGPCQWMDQPLADAWIFGRVRQAAERMPAAEKFSSAAMALTPGGYPWFDLTTGWHNLLSNFEHTIGAACWRCSSAEGARHYETEIVEHREEGLTAAAISQRSLDDALARLGARIQASHTNGIAVFNPLARARTDIVPFSAPAGRTWVAVDDATGLSTPCQRLADGSWVFVASDVPALGYRTFHLVEHDAPATESRFYEIQIDPDTGAVASLFDKELNRQLISTNSPHAFNQYLYEGYESAQRAPARWSKLQSGAEVTTAAGPVATVCRVRTRSEGVHWLEQTITVYHGIKRIDFALLLDKKPSGRTLADYAANNYRGKEAVFVALPFDIPGFKAAYQTGGGGVAEPIRDQFQGTATAFYAVQHFADISNDKFGVTVSPLDCALVEFDHPRSDALSRTTAGSEKGFEKKMEYPKRPSLYLYLMNNMFTTNIRVDQRGEHLFRWSLRSHAGNWQDGGADRFGESVNQPLVARPIQPGGSGLPAGAQSFACVDVANVSISTCKPAEWNGDGFIVRLNETAGRRTTAQVSLPFLGPVAAANETTLVEDDLALALPVSGNAFRIEVPAFGVKTVRVRSSTGPCAEVSGVKAAAQSDLAVALEWNPVPGAAFYRVYRDTTADFKPSLLTLVATPAAAACVDRAKNYTAGWIANRLHPETRYYYRVEAVSPHNLRGPSSAAIAVTTAASAQRACPPGPVQDLHAILVSPLAPANCINLLWRSNVEPNIAAYEIHRSTQADFTPTDSTVLAKAAVQSSAKATAYRGLDHQMFLDEKTDLNTTYHYKVRAVTATGLAGDFSACASVATKGAKAPTTAPLPARSLMGNDGAQQ